MSKPQRTARARQEAQLARDLMHAEVGLTYAQALARARKQLDTAHHKATFL